MIDNAGGYGKNAYQPRGRSISRAVNSTLPCLSGFGGGGSARDLVWELRAAGRISAAAMVPDRHCAAGGDRHDVCRDRWTRARPRGGGLHRGPARMQAGSLPSWRPKRPGTADPGPRGERPLSYSVRIASTRRFASRTASSWLWLRTSQR